MPSEVTTPTCARALLRSSCAVLLASLAACSSIQTSPDVATQIDLPEVHRLKEFSAVNRDGEARISGIMASRHWEHGHLRIELIRRGEVITDCEDVPLTQWRIARPSRRGRISAAIRFSEFGVGLKQRLLPGDVVRVIYKD